MTPNEAADFLNVSRGTVTKPMDDGTLPFRSVGTHRRVPTAAVIAYDLKQRAQADAALNELTRLSRRWVSTTWTTGCRNAGAPSEAAIALYQEHFASISHAQGIVATPCAARRRPQGERWGETCRMLVERPARSTASELASARGYLRRIFSSALPLASSSMSLSR
jgi:excisionase family DNA binding protein